jgi:hypothetical protein
VKILSLRGYPFNDFAFRIDCLYTMFGPQVNALFFPKDMGLSNYKIIDLPTGISNIVRNPSGAVRDVSRLLQD